jgi:hypothetical protein
MRVNEVIITRIDGASDSTGHERNQLDYALGAPATLAQIDADVLRRCRQRGSAQDREDHP